MDFNEITEGVTVFLPVNQPGALLYLGDGHAAQGDGELNGNALETSMEVVTGDMIHDKRVRTPRVESDSQITTVGLGPQWTAPLPTYPPRQRGGAPEWATASDPY